MNEDRLPVHRVLERYKTALYGTAYDLAATKNVLQRLILASEAASRVILGFDAWTLKEKLEFRDLVKELRDQYHDQ